MHLHGEHSLIEKIGGTECGKPWPGRSLRCRENSRHIGIIILVEHGRSRAHERINEGQRHDAECAGQRSPLSRPPDLLSTRVFRREKPFTGSRLKALDKKGGAAEAGVQLRRRPAASALEQAIAQRTPVTLKPIPSTTALSMSSVTKSSTFTFADFVSRSAFASATPGRAESDFSTLAVQ